MFNAFYGGNAIPQRPTSLPPFSPGDYASSKLRLWLRPESAKWQTSARSTAETGTGVIGAWDDDSGNGFHALQATFGSRPSRKTNGGVAFNGSVTMQTNSALGAWTGDYAVLSVFHMTTTPAANNPRMVEINSSTGYSLTQSLTAGYVISNGGEGSPSFGQTLAASIGSIHTCLDYRMGTVHGTSIDGVAATTNTVTSAALTDTALNLAYSVGFPGNVFTGNLHEIVVVKSPTSGDLLDLASYLSSRVTAGVYY